MKGIELKTKGIELIMKGIELKIKGIQLKIQVEFWVSEVSWPGQAKKKVEKWKIFLFFFYFLIFVDARLKTKIEKYNFVVWGVLAWLGLGWPRLGWAGWIFKILFFYFFLRDTCREIWKNRKKNRNYFYFSIFFWGAYKNTGGAN